MFNKKINLQHLDRIILNDDDIKTIDNKLKIYIDNNPKLRAKVRELPFKIALKGLYILKREEDKEQLQIKELVKKFGMNDEMYSKHFESFYYYDIQGDVIKVAQLDKDGNIQFIVSFDENVNHLNTQAFDKLYQGNSVKEYVINIAKSSLAQIMNFMMYTQLMAFLNEESAIIKRQTKIKGFQPKKLTKKEREREARKRISVSKPKVDYDYSEAQREGDTRSYNRVAESWEVEGHWRTIKKSGKRVFVKGYKKGNGNNVQRKGKDFTI